MIHIGLDHDSKSKLKRNKFTGIAFSLPVSAKLLKIQKQKRQKQVLATTSTTTVGHIVSGPVGMGMGRQRPRRTAIKIKQATIERVAWIRTASASSLLSPSPSSAPLLLLCNG